MDDLTKLQGAWRIVYAETNGTPVPRDQYDNVQIEITGDVGKETEGAVSMSVKFQLDPSCVPKAIDSTYLDGPQQGFTSLGIYQLDADAFEMCRTSTASEPRPKTFATTAGSGLVMVVWNRPMV